MGKPVQVRYIRTIYSCSGHETNAPGCPFCWVMNQGIGSEPSHWQVIPDER